MESQLKLNQEVLITIKSIGIDGEGVGFYKRQAVFVPGALPPEEVVIKVTKIKKGYAVGEIVRIKKKSFYRRKPFCKHFTKCGGCQLQHVEYEEQQRLKEQLLKQSFERFTDLDLRKIKFHHFNPIVKPRHYRHQANMFIVNTKSEGVMTALPDLKGDNLVEVPSCPITDEAINRTNQRVLEICDDNDIFAFDEKSKRGMLRRLVTRKSHYNGEIQVTLVVTIFNKVLKTAAKQILDLEDVSSVAISKNHDINNKNTFGETHEILEGKATIEERLGDIIYKLSPVDRFPINPFEAENMFEYVSTLLKESSGKTMLNLFAGSGVFALYHAHHFDALTAVDVDPKLVQSAQHSAKANKIKNIHFQSGDESAQLQKFNDKHIMFDTALLSPPKHGLNQPLIKQIKSSGIHQLIYVSKNPSTLAKDINHLKSAYRLISVMPFDMHPQSSRVDSVALLQKN